MSASRCSGDNTDGGGTKREPCRAQNAGIPCYRTVGTGDIYKTLCAMAGASLPATVSGRNLTPLLDDSRAPWSIPALTTITKTNHNAMRAETLRYIRSNGDTNNVELYQMDLDPNEITKALSHGSYASDRAAMDSLLQTAPIEGDLPAGIRTAPAQLALRYWDSADDFRRATNLADPDDDGLANLWECALLTDPLVTSTDGKPMLLVLSNTPPLQLGYHFYHREMTNDLTYRAWRAADFLTWSNIWHSGASENVSSVTLTNHGDGRRVLQVPISTVAEDQGFLRLEVSSP